MAPILLDSIGEVEKHLKIAIENVVSRRCTLKVRGKEERKAGLGKSGLCFYNLPFYQADAARERVDSHLIEFVNSNHIKFVKEEKDMDKGNDFRNTLFGIRSGVGNGKSHFLDHVINELQFDGREGVFFFPIMFRDVNLMSAFDSKDLKAGNYPALIGRRMIWSYLVDVASIDENKENRENDSSNDDDENQDENKDENKADTQKLTGNDKRDLWQPNAIFYRFCQLLSRENVETSYEMIIKSIVEEIKSNGKKLVVVIDDVIGGLKSKNCELGVLRAAADLKLQIIFATQVDSENQLTLLSGHDVKWEYIDGINLKEKIKIEMPRRLELEVNETGEFLLNVLGQNSRSFGAFWFAVKNDAYLRNLCCNSTMKTMENDVVVNSQGELETKSNDNENMLTSIVDNEIGQNEIMDKNEQLNDASSRANGTPPATARHDGDGDEDDSNDNRENKTSISQAMEKFWQYYESGEYSPTNVYCNIFSNRKRKGDFLSILCMFLLGIERCDLKLDDGTDTHLEGAIDFFDNNGLVTIANISELKLEKTRLMYISPMTVYAFSEKEKDNKITNSDLLEINELAFDNIANYLDEIFQTIFGRWDGLAVERLIGLLICLRLNCLKYLVDKQLIKHNRSYLELQNILHFGKHSKKVDAYKQNESYKKRVSTNLSQEILSPSSLIPPTATHPRQAQATKVTGEMKLDIDAMKWKDIRNIIKFDFFGDTYPNNDPNKKLTKEEKKVLSSKKKDAKEKEKDEKHNGKVVKEILLGFLNRAVICDFADGNPSFDYLFHLPVEIYGWIWLFGDCKSRGRTEGAPKKKDITDRVSVETALSSGKKNQYDKFLETMKRTKCFENETVSYILFADFPLKESSRYKEVEAIENCVFEFAGYGFGAFLKNAVLNRQYYQYDYYQ